MNKHHNIGWSLLIDEYFFAKPLRTATEWSYRKVYHSFINYVGLSSKPEDITRHTVLRWRRYVLKDKQLSSRTWNNKVAHMRAIFNFGMQQHLLPFEENPFNNTVVPPDRKRKKTYTQSQIAHIYRIMDSFEEREQLGLIQSTRQCAIYPVWFWYTLLDTLHYTGMRQNQLLHIRLKDIFLEEGYIRLRTEGCKNHREHHVPIISYLSPRLSSLLEKATAEGLSGNDQLFNIVLFTGKPAKINDSMESPQLRAFFRRLAKECQFEVSPHRFRHTLATEMMKSPDQNLNTAKNVLGHSSMTSTLEYIESDVGTMGQVLEAQFKRLKTPRVATVYNDLTKSP